jgi:hypothetical protein
MMSLYNAIDSLPEGARLNYTSSDGTTVVIYQPFVHGPGVLSVIVHTATTDASGKHHVSRHEYEGIEREWCDRQEQVLRDLGIDPDKYTIV